MSERDDEPSGLPPMPSVEDGSAAVIAQHRRNLFSRVGSGGATLGGSASVSVVYPPATPPILAQALVVSLGPRTSEGQIIEAVTTLWSDILAELERNPSFLYQIPWDKMEQFIAGAYHRRGWQVELTPRGSSGDKGRDIIATRRDISIRIIEQVKTYKPGHRVRAADVDALVGALSKEGNVSKGIVTTTSDFAPGILEDEALKRLQPCRLELRNGEQLRQWLAATQSPPSQTDGQ